MVDAATLRLRPILMTTGAMVLGALPLALAHGAGAESRTQIGWVIVGGMSFGTLLTLFVVPTAYTLLVRAQDAHASAGPSSARAAVPVPQPGTPTSMRRTTRRGTRPLQRRRIRASRDTPPWRPICNRIATPKRQTRRIPRGCHVSPYPGGTTMSHPVRRLARLAAALALGIAATAAQAVTEIQWWHSMTGALGDRVNSLADRFNESQRDYKVVPVFKGTYPESMAAAIAAYRAEATRRAILQVFEVGTATMMAAKGAIKPVYQLMADAGEKFDPKAYVPAVAGLLLDAAGPDAVVPVQQLDARVLFQQGRVREGGARPRPAAVDLAGVAAAAAKLRAVG